MYNFIRLLDGRYTLIDCLQQVLDDNNYPSCPLCQWCTDTSSIHDCPTLLSCNNCKSSFEKPVVELILDKGWIAHDLYDEFGDKVDKHLVMMNLCHNMQIHNKIIWVLS